MTDEIKKIAVAKLIEIKGKNYIEKNKDNFAISYSDDNSKYVITFLISQSSNRNSNAITNFETPIKEYLSVSVNKETLECKVLENNL